MFCSAQGQPADVKSESFDTPSSFQEEWNINSLFHLEDEDSSIQNQEA